MKGRTCVPSRPISEPSGRPVRMRKQPASNKACAWSFVRSIVYVVKPGKGGESGQAMVGVDEETRSNDEM